MAPVNFAGNLNIRWAWFIRLTGHIIRSGSAPLGLLQGSHALLKRPERLLSLLIWRTLSLLKLHTEISCWAHIGINDWAAPLSPHHKCKLKFSARSEKGPHMLLGWSERLLSLLIWCIMSFMKLHAYPLVSVQSQGRQAILKKRCLLSLPARRCQCLCVNICMAQLRMDGKVRGGSSYLSQGIL